MNSTRRSVVVTSLLILLAAFTSVMAQNMNTSNLTTSPYSRYGYGRLGSLGNTVTRSMGDVGIAVRSNLFTSLANPASLTAIDTLTMIFTVDLDAQLGTYDEGEKRTSKWDAGFAGMSFQAPLWRNFAMSLSLSPYSQVGYYYGDSERKPIQNPTSTRDTLTFANSHIGVGGVNNFVFGLGWRAFRTKRQEFNLGAQAGWLFGLIQHSGSLSTSSQANGTIISYDASIRGLYLRLGAQYTVRPDADNSFTLGAIYSPQLNLSVNADINKYSTDTISLSDRYRNAVKQPQQMGVGLTWQWARKLIVSAEYELDSWSKVNGLDPDMNLRSDLFNDVQRVALGAEYRPKLATNHFFQACRYRAGVNTKTNYVKVNGQKLQEYGATVGISMPVNKRSSLDFGFGYRTLRAEQSSMLNENYFTINLGLTFNEMMFFRNMLR